MSTLHNTIACVNGKGGVGKTSVVANVAGILANSGWKVLAVDLDPQGNLQKDLGYRAHPDHDQGASLFRALTAGEALAPILTNVRENLDVVPGGEQLVYADAGLGRQGFDQRLLAARLAPIADQYDVIMIDCPPAGGIMGTLAMGAARGLIIPVKADDGSTEGLELVARQFEQAKTGTNPELQVLGVVIFALESGASAIRDTMRSELSAALGEIAPVFDSIIRHSSRSAFDTRRNGELVHEYERVAESSKGQRLLALRKGSRALGQLRRFSTSATGLAEDYAALTEEVVERFNQVAQ